MAAPSTLRARLAARLGNVNDPSSHAAGALATLVVALTVAASVVRLAQTLPIEP